LTNLSHSGHSLLFLFPAVAAFELLAWEMGGAPALAYCKQSSYTKCQGGELTGCLTLF
jgi:hypothetical protein